MEQLQYYGEPIAKYEAQGFLVLDGAPQACGFEAGQLRDGKILMFCDLSIPIEIKNRVSGFSGTTKKGIKFSLMENFTILEGLHPNLPRLARLKPFP